MFSACFEFSVTPDNNGSTVKTFLRKSCGITARSMTVLKYGDGGIFCGDTELKAHDIVRSGDVITLRLPAETNEILPIEGGLTILFEDDFLMIVNKPAGMPVHPTKVHQTDTLANIVSYYQQKRGESYVFRALNRLDKDTSGCVLIAKDRLTCSQIRDRVQKTYTAVCEGIISNKGTIDRPIGLAENSKIKRTIRPDGLHAVTHYHPLRTGNGHTMLELWLETGRTHQIRCHMSSIGHPLAGDDLYGGSRDHPVTKGRITVTAEIPQEFLQIIIEGK